MATVFVVEHLHVLPHGESDLKMIGVYATRAEADAAVERLKDQPGFNESPDVVDPVADSEEGFHINEYIVGQDHWTEGFVTV